MSRKENSEVLAWVIPPAANVTTKDLTDFAGKVKTRVHVRYMPRQREFVVFTLDGVANVLLDTLLGNFRQQRISLQHRSP